MRSQPAWLRGRVISTSERAVDEEDSLQPCFSSWPVALLAETEASTEVLFPPSFRAQVPEPTADHRAHRSAVVCPEAQPQLAPS
jgi:hypothetical protein